jgi:thiol-disulfide isomerase/thioredoxin
MKFTILIFFSLCSTISWCQTIDLTFIEQYVIGTKYRTDTSTFLPSYTFTNDKGDSTLLSEYKGKILYVNIWSTYCGACIAEFPHQEQLLNRLKKIHLDTTIIFININIEDSKRNWKKALQKYHPVGVNLHSSDESLYDNWKIPSLPCHILISKTGYLLGLKVARPDAADIDWILYCSTKGINLIEAIWRAFNQNKLMEKYKSSSVFTDKEYADWWNDTIDARVEYYMWSKKMYKKS